jgi:hypothetical protein
MRSLALTGIVALGVLASVMAGSAPAQAYPSYGPVYGPGYGSYGRSRPALSPFLDLTRGGNPAANYYLGVVPETARRANMAVLNSAVNDLERRVENPPAAPAVVDDLLGGLANGGLPPTGHAASFGNYGTYYNVAGTAALPTRPSQASVGPRR